MDDRIIVQAAEMWLAAREKAIGLLGANLPAAGAVTALAEAEAHLAACVRQRRKEQPDG